MNDDFGRHASCYSMVELSEEEWNDLLPTFSDATIYQTAAYGNVRWGSKNCCRLGIKKDGLIVSCAQVIIRRIAFLNVGIAFIPWGPLWRKNGEQEDWTTFGRSIDVITAELAIKRKLVLRIHPAECLTNVGQAVSILLNRKFMPTKRGPYTTILMNISDTTDIIREKMGRKWRNHLNKAIKTGLEIEYGTGSELFDCFMQLSEQMLRRKKFTPGVDYREFREIQKLLPEKQKMLIMVCRYEKKPQAVIVTSHINGRAIYLLGATGDSGLKLNGSNLLQWNMVRELKQRGCEVYDLGGVNKERSPGVFLFKSEMAGKNGTVVSHIGEFQFSHPGLSRIAFAVLDNIRRL